MNLITLLRYQGLWVARYSGPHSYPIIHRLGTADIPLLFHHDARPGVIAEALAWFSPECTIQVNP
jgi:hypothetical protein